MILEQMVGLKGATMDRVTRETGAGNNFNIPPHTALSGFKDRTQVTSDNVYLWYCSWRGVKTWK